MWECTPRAAAVIADGAVARLEAEHNRFAWHAWNSAALARQRRLPPMRSLMIRRRKRRQTWQEQRDIARMITMQAGGRVA